MGCVFARLRHRNMMDLNSHPRMFRVINVDNEGNPVVEGVIEIGDEELILHEANSTSTHWPLRSLRRYGCDHEMFSFECGRRCSTGAGIYAFKSDRAEELFNMLQDRVHHAGQDLNDMNGHVVVGRHATVQMISPHVQVARMSNGPVWSPASMPRTNGNAVGQQNFSPVRQAVGQPVAPVSPPTSMYRSNVRNLSVFPTMSSVAQGVHRDTAGAADNSLTDYMKPVPSASPTTTATVSPAVPLTMAVVPQQKLQYADLDLENPTKTDFTDQVLSPSHVAYQNIDVYLDNDVFREHPAVKDARFYVNTDDMVLSDLPVAPNPPKHRSSDLPNASHNFTACNRFEANRKVSNSSNCDLNTNSSNCNGGNGPTEGYAVIDFTKTAAINAKNLEDEGSRKTRHNSNIDDLLL